ncbi:MAG: DUF898 family protein [Nitrospirae bacterium]|nr:DUF898 family protein [Nitrospirota bacterium]
MAMISTLSAKSAALRLSFYGPGGTLFGIQIVNLLLTIMTLGIYSFWGKVRVRKYLYSQTEFSGDRFTYHGTGKELFIGALKAFAIVIVFWVTVVVLAKLVGPMAVLLVYPVILVAIPYALYGTMRYIMSRSSWRGIRFSFRGDLKECMKTYIGGVLLTLLTLGLYYPYFHTKMRRYWINNTYFGNIPFHYDGEGKDLFGSFVLAVLLTIPTLYLYWFWYAAKVGRYDWSRTKFSGGQFESTVTGGALLGLSLTNLLLLILTLGLAFPWVIVRSLKFQFHYLTLHGELGLSKIQQDARGLRIGATGEELAGALDVGSALG